MESSAIIAILLLALPWGFAMQEEVLTAAPTTVSGQRNQTNSLPMTPTATVEAKKSTGITTANRSTTAEANANQTTIIGANQTATVGANKTTTIGESQTATVGQNQTATIGANKKTTVGANQTTAVGANITTTVGATTPATVEVNTTTTFKTSSASSIITTMVPIDVTNSGGALKPSCLTGRLEKGVCVSRQLCEYGTGAIDFSLYAPHNYFRTCSTAEVCCPELYVVKMKEQPSQDNNFTFDDDD